MVCCTVLCGRWIIAAAHCWQRDGGCSKRWEDLIPDMGRERTRLRTIVSGCGPKGIGFTSNPKARRCAMSAIVQAGREWARRKAHLQLLSRKLPGGGKTC